MPVLPNYVTRTIFILVVALVLAAVVNNFYIFYIQKNYEFIVESPCNLTAESCFIRSCGDEECPPNELSHYRMFAIKARDFGKCRDNSCFSECSSGLIECKEIMCSEDDACTSVSLEE